MTKKEKRLRISILILVIVIFLGAYLYKRYWVAPQPTSTTNGQTVTPDTASVTIADTPIAETNFTGTKSVITGSGQLADAARTYIDQTVADFKTGADQDVPSIKAQFGASDPASQYEIDIKATYVEAPETRSIIIDDYEYTGGANGNNTYKVFTASAASGKVLSLSDVIPASKQAAFTAYVKEQLSTWTDGTDTPVVFDDQVKALTFDSFTNWSFDDKNLIIYFDKYDIAPGALGPIAFPLSKTSITSYLAQGY